MKFKENIYKDLKKYSLDNPNQEVCALLYKRNEEIFLKQCKNIHNDPENFFRISALDYLKTNSLGEITTVFHSHPKTGGPSEKDIEMSKNLSIPFLVYSILKNKFYYI